MGHFTLPGRILGQSLAPAFLLCTLAGGNAATAQVTAHGPELQVNTYTTGNQFLGKAASLGRGEFVVVWQSAGSAGSDSNGYSIQMQRFDAEGRRLGDEYQVNVDTAFDQEFPSVAASSQGDFVVVWDNGGFESGWGWNVRGRRFDARGVPLGPEFAVSGAASIWSFSRYPTVASDPAGNFVVAWESFDFPSYTFSIAARGFAATGVPLSPVIVVNDLGLWGQDRPAVAESSLGQFVVAWQSQYSAGSDPDLSIQARLFDRLGTPLGPQFQVNSFTPGLQQHAGVGGDPRGDFVVVWDSPTSPSGDPDWAVLAQRFDAAGTPIGGEFQVNSFTPGAQWWGVVAVARSGESVVAWTSGGSDGTDRSLSSVQAQRFGADWVPFGNQFQVNTYTLRSQSSDGVAMDGDGNFIVVWSSDGSSGTDADLSSVHAQLYDQLFRDGFESGDTSRWSAIEP